MIFRHGIPQILRQRIMFNYPLPFAMQTQLLLLNTYFPLHHNHHPHSAQYNREKTHTHLTSRCPRKRNRPRRSTHETRNTRTGCRTSTRPSTYSTITRRERCARDRRRSLDRRKTVGARRSSCWMCSLAGVQGHRNDCLGDYSWKGRGCRFALRGIVGAWS